LEARGAVLPKASTENTLCKVETVAYCFTQPNLLLLPITIINPTKQTNLQLTALLDTGSSVNAIAMSTITRLGGTVTTADTMLPRIVDLRGNTIADTTRNIYNLHIVIPGFTSITEHPFRVIDHPRISAVVGLPWMRAVAANIDMLTFSISFRILHDDATIVPASGDTSRQWSRSLPLTQIALPEPPQNDDLTTNLNTLVASSTQNNSTIPASRDGKHNGDQLRIPQCKYKSTSEAPWILGTPPTSNAADHALGSNDLSPSGSPHKSFPLHIPQHSTPSNGPPMPGQANA
jgi:hypothetical protein